MHNFTDLIELFDYFKDQATCLAYLEQQRWDGTPACPFCGVVAPYRTNRGFKCREKTCGKKFTVLVGTVYENTKIPLRKWFGAIYLCTSSKKGISSLQAGRQLSVTQKTAWFLLHRVREMLKAKAPYTLRDTVQIDETYVGGKEHNKHAKKRSPLGQRSGGRSADIKTPVFGIVENGGKVVVHVTTWVSKKKAEELITKYVAEGSTIVSDGLSMYAFLGKDGRFKHVIVDHKKGEYVKKGFHTNGIENFWSLLKRGIIGIFHQISPWHLQRYCDEFASRYNSRDIKDHERFDLALRNSNGRLKYKDLIKHEENNELG